MAVVNHTHLDLVILNDLLVHVLQEFDLLSEEALQAERVEWTSGALLVSHVSVHLPQAVLKDLEPVLCELVVQLPEVGDGANSGKDGVILDGRGAWTERSHHGDTLGGAKGTKGLVFEVAALEDDSGTLSTIISLYSGLVIWEDLHSPSVVL